MNLFHFIFYMAGVIPLTNCILGGLKHLDDRWGAHVFHEIFGFSLFLVSISWASAGVAFGLYTIHFVLLLVLELAIPFVEVVWKYEEPVKVYLIRKIITLLVICRIMTEAFFTYCYC